MLKVDDSLARVYKDFVSEIYRSLGREVSVTLRGATAEELSPSVVITDIFPEGSLLGLLAGIKSVLANLEGKEIAGIEKFINYLMTTFGKSAGGKSYTGKSLKNFLRLFIALSFLKPHFEKAAEEASSKKTLLDRRGRVRQFLKYMDFYEKVNHNAADRNFIVLPLFNPKSPQKDNQIILWWEEKGKGKKRMKIFSFSFRIDTDTFKDLYIQGSIGRKKVSLNITVSSYEVKKRLETEVGTLKRNLKRGDFSLENVNFVVKARSQKRKGTNLEVIV